MLVKSSHTVSYSALAWLPQIKHKKKQLVTNKFDAGSIILCEDPLKHNSHFVPVYINSKWYMSCYTYCIHYCKKQPEKIKKSSLLSWTLQPSPQSPFRNHNSLVIFLLFWPCAKNPILTLPYSVTTSLRTLSGAILCNPLSEPILLPILASQFLVLLGVCFLFVFGLIFL